MKSNIRQWLVSGCLVFIALTAAAQNERAQTITYISRIPLLIRSELFVRNIGADHIFYPVSGKISVALLPRKITVQSENYARISKPLPYGDLEKIEYRFFTDSQVKNSWRPLPGPATGDSTFPYGGLLADIFLKPNEKLVIQFRYKGTDTILQQNIFNRTGIVPVITRFRQKNNFDSLDDRMKSNLVKTRTALWEGFDSLQKKEIHILPGHALDLLFSSARLNNDSCIRFRLMDKQTNEKTNWKLTGHLLSLHNIQANRSYILEVRYESMQAINAYEINSSPYWYQSYWATILFIITGLLFITGLPYLVYRNRIRKERDKRLLAQEQLKMVQSQLNPHFIYNSLSSIETLITNNENDRANKYLNVFADIMRDTMENSGLIMVSLSDEITMLEKYIHIEQLRSDFRYIINVDKTLQVKIIEFPPMLLQPSVENAVKHGVGGLEKEGVIEISFRAVKQDLMITITDNGKNGSPTAKPRNGRGIALTHDRIRHLQQLYKSGSIHYAIEYLLGRTTVTFNFKNWLS